MLSFEPADKTVPEVFALMLDAIAPRPIAFASTIDSNGKPNLSPFSFFNVFGANPPILIFSPSRKGKDNTTKDTFENVKVVPEVVINMVNYEMVQQMNLASTEFPRGINEFEKAGFTQLKSDLVKPYRLKESPVQIECKVIQVIETGTMASAGNLVICEAVKFHYQENIFNEKGQVDPYKIDLVGRMGRDYYIRANGNAIFTVEKPGKADCIGIDGLPESIKRSKVLSGNDLGILGGLNRIPEMDEIIAFVTSSIYWDQLVNLKNDPNAFMYKKHMLAKELLEQNKKVEALQILLFEV